MHGTAVVYKGIRMILGRILLNKDNSGNSNNNENISGIGRIQYMSGSNNSNAKI